MGKNNNFKIKIGGAYCVYMDKLRACNFYYIIDEIEYKEFCADVFYSEDIICTKNVPVFMQYIGNGIFKEVLTGKTISVLKNGGIELLEDGIAVNNDGTYSDYKQIIPVLSHIYEHPFVISANNISLISEDDLDNYSAHKSEDIKKMLKESEDIARRTFEYSLEQYIDYDYRIAKEENEQREKQLIK